MYWDMHSLPMAMNPAEGLPTEDISGRTSGIALLETTPGIDPRASVDDYNRVMLQYTQRQIEAFTQAGDNMLGRRNSGNSRSSGSSGQSNTSSMTNMAGAGSGLPPQQTRRDGSTQSPGSARD
ncbi:conserved hypothetical protein [Talaromyces stipitatus ATCC 10500]|uniref:Uncharacterized protein n=1 Tax=Talaromyces stipitatus (strain ATCC 10500 / CBS 375.48 / QM 6759 / NRRL 1006) TaxID=441959 RepID=B8MDH1_TALSN|nr:uncharacterized protein TSTA_117200 [Talaromyces stipitatus ATCC 10500]EED17934.1 conserved hypothetical protein [Talaromyces stipitatus ATCC 10500]